LKSAAGEGLLHNSINLSNEEGIIILKTKIKINEKIIRKHRETKKKKGQKGQTKGIRTKGK
jgi:hypothetical protein